MLAQAGAREPVRTSAALVHVVTLRAQGVADMLGGLRIVFNQQDLHVAIFRTGGLGRKAPSALPTLFRGRSGVIPV